MTFFLAYFLLFTVFFHLYIFKLTYSNKLIISYIFLIGGGNNLTTIEHLGPSIQPQQLFFKTEFNFKRDASNVFSFKTWMTYRTRGHFLVL
mgnify:CR=1 FL=1